MKQIKTVIQSINNYAVFDSRVNALLQDNWKLTKRTTINIQSEPNEVGSTAIVQALYAELEKDKNDFEEITL